MGLKCKDCSNFDANNNPYFFSNEGYCNLYNKYKDPDSDMCDAQKNHLKNNLNSSDNSYQASGCTYTTILNYILGYADNCEMLVIFRTFRETYLKIHQEYLPLLLEYDLTGPVICLNLLKDPKRVEFCLAIAKNFIIPMVTLIQEEKNEDAILCYRNMLSAIMERYAIEPIELPENPEYQMETLGKGRLRMINNTI